MSSRGLAEKTEALRVISDSLIQKRAAHVAAFDLAMQRLSADLRERLVSILAKQAPTAAEAMKAQTIVDLQREVQKQLNALGYEGVLKDFLGQYQESHQAALAAIEALGLEPPKLSRLDAQALRSLAAQDYAYLDGIGAAAIQEVAGGVVADALAGGSRARMIDRVGATVNKQFRRYAVTYADTALVSYDRVASMRYWKAAGLERFMYRGPKDIKNRKFCEAHVGKVYGLAQIAELKNGMKDGTADVLRFGGGWNCRHVWTPVPPEAPARPPAPAQQAKRSYPAPAAVVDLVAEQPNAIVTAAMEQGAREGGAAVQRAQQRAKLEATAEAKARIAHDAAVARAKKAVAASEAEAAGAAAQQAQALQEAAMQAAKDALAALEAQQGKAAEQGAKLAAAKQKKLVYAKAWHQAQAVEKAVAKLGPDATVEQIEAALAQKKQFFAGLGFKVPPKLLKEEAALGKLKAELAAQKAAEEAAAKAAAEAQAKLEAEAKAKADLLKDPAYLKAIKLKATHQVQAIEAKMAKAAALNGGTLAEPQAASFVQAMAQVYQEKGLPPSPTVAKYQADWQAGKLALKPAAAKKKAQEAFAQAAAQETPPATPEPEAPPKPPPRAKPPSGLASVYADPASGQKWRWSPEEGSFVSEAGQHAPAAKVEAWAKKGFLEPAAQVQMVPTAPPPAPAGFALVGDASGLGGMHEKQVWKDAAGDAWLFKPQERAGEEFRVRVEAAQSAVAKLVNPEAVEVRAMTLGGRFGSAQRMARSLAEPKDFGTIPPEQMTAQEVRDVQREQVIDWLTANHDAHPGQWLRTPEGRTLGIDKAQSYRWLGEDRLAVDYHPNARYGEREPLYNSMFRAIKEGRLRFDPRDTLEWVRRAERISDADLLAALRPYAEGRFKGDATGLKRFQDGALARKNALRADFEAFYSDVLGRPFRFEEEPAPAPRAERKPKYARLTPRLAEHVAEAHEAGWQGKTIPIGGEQIEDQALMVWGERMPDGSERTVLQFKVRNLPEANEAIARRLAQGRQATKVAPTDPDRLVPYPKSAVSNKALKVWIETGEMLPKDGYGNPIPAEKAAIVRQEAAEWKRQNEEAKAAAKRKRKEPAPPAEFEVETSEALGDRKEMKDGRVRVLQADVPIKDLVSNGHGDYGKSVGVRWRDGFRVRYQPNVPSETNGYALQGTMQAYLPGKADAAQVDAALDRLSREFGLDLSAPTAAQREMMYLQKQAYATKAHVAPQWKALEARLAQAGAPPEEAVREMRAFWARRLGVEDVTKLPGYNPEGEWQGRWNDPTGRRRAGQIVYRRFDLSEADLDREMKGYTLQHGITGKSLEEACESIVGTNNAMIPTVDKMRVGVPVGGMSPGSDIDSGGASYFFTRIKRASSVADEPGLYFKKRLLLRMDAISYDGDEYGRTTGDTVTNHRKTGPEEWRAAARRHSNETILKGALPLLDDLEVIRVRGEEARQRILRMFRDAGIAKLPDGRTIERAVVAV